MNRNIIRASSAPEPIGPYNQAVKINGMLFASGQIAINPLNGELVLGNLESETQCVMNNLKAVLNAADMDFGHVIKVSIFLTDMADFSTVNEVYGRYFEDNYPARETVEVSALPKNVNVEISLIAAE